MKKITNREKIIIGFGAIMAITVITYFFILPIVRNDKSSSTLEANQEELQSIKKLKGMEPVIAQLEKEMETQLGYDKITFTKKSAESAIMTQLAQMASQSEIKEVEQLDIKPEKGKKKQTDQRDNQIILKSVVDRLYLAQVNSEKNNPIASENTKNTADNQSVKEAKTDNKDTAEKENDASEEALTDSGMTFPVIPKDIPDKAKLSLVKSLQTLEGKTLSSEDIDEVVQSSDIKDEQETDRIKKRLIMYNNRVKEKKNDVLSLISNLGIVQKLNTADQKNKNQKEKIGRFTIKMVFKSDLSQLVKLLYNIQDSAKWVKIEGMNISVADRQKSLLAVELAMTASTLYELDTTN
jgi:hypothetical protein